MGGDVIDYTYLKKRGLLKIKDIPKSNNLDLKSGYADLTSNTNKLSNEPALPVQNESPLSFLDSLAGSVATQTKADNAVDTLEIKDLKVKIEDLEYKLERLIERLERIESER